jgi:ADP-ribose pyrophosphatase YjhB (NUDIX family)
MFKYCPSCASTNIIFEKNNFRCPDCGFVYYHNTAAATGCLIRANDNLVFLVRGKEPSIGKLDLPGGFVDPGEGVLQGLYRELQEEIGWVPPIPQGASLFNVFTLFASFPNIYPYKNINYNTCDMYFSVDAPGLTAQDLHLQKSEIADIRFLKPQEINFDDFAFTSTKKAIQSFLC